MGVSLPFDINLLKSNWYISALYRQTVTIYEPSPGTILPIRRAITIGDFKSCDKSVIFNWRRGRDSLTFDRQIIDEATFARAFRAAVDKLPSDVARECGTDGMPEAYATVMWFLDPQDTAFNYALIKDTPEFDNPQGLGAPVGYDFGFDIDPDDNGWFDGPHGFEIVGDFLSLAGRKLGVRLEALVSRGVQGRVTMLDVQLGLYEAWGIKWVNAVWRDVPNAHKALAKRLAELYDRVPVRIDEKFYDRARVTRLAFSLHGGIRGFSIPFSPSFLATLSEREVRRRQQDIRYVRHVARDYLGPWGMPQDAQGYMNFLTFYLDLSFKWELPRAVAVQSVRRRLGTRVRQVTVPGRGVLCYDEAISGFHWIEVLIKNKICIKDARLALMYLVVNAVLGGGLRDAQGNRVRLDITYDDVKAWVVECVSKYPSGKSVDEYLEKLEDNLKLGERYNAPTFETLASGLRRDGKPRSGLYDVLASEVVDAFVGVRLAWWCNQ